MPTTDFARILLDYLVSYIPARGLSRHTLRSYRDCLGQFLKYCRDVRSMNIRKIEMKDITAKLAEEFLGQLGDGHYAMSTYNQRLAALQSFMDFALLKSPETLAENQAFHKLARKKCPKPVIKKLEADYLEALLRAPDIHTRQGRRDATMMTVMYDLGIRVSELSGITVRDVQLEKPCSITVTGKGDKQRAIPMHDGTAKLLKGYMKEWKMTTPNRLNCILFPGHSRDGRLTTSGITYILQKYAARLHDRFPSISPKITPHMLRHSKGMHMAREGVSIIYIHIHPRYVRARGHFNNRPVHSRNKCRKGHRH